MGRHETIPSRRLRGAVEFALEVAAGLDDDQPVPDAIRRHRRRPVSAQAIGALRRAVDGDEAFRMLVAEALVTTTGLDAVEATNGVGVGVDGVGGDVDAGDDAVDDAGDDEGPVDTVGSLWLMRPPGWRAAVDLLLELERQQSEIEAVEAARRREERRREAAEAHVEREKSERRRIERRLDALKSELGTATDRIAELERELEMARHDLNEARMRARHAGDRERAALDRLQRAEADLRPSAGPDGSGADSTGDRSASSAPVSEAEWRASIAEALIERLRRQGGEMIEELVERVTGHLADQFLDQLLGEVREEIVGEVPAASGGETSSDRPTDRITVARGSTDADPPTQPSGRRPRRRALRMPPGVLSESAAGVEFVLRSRARVIVDGYNVAKTAWPKLELNEQRERLIAMLETLAERHGIDVQVIFDGAEVVGAATSQRRSIDIMFSPPGVIADTVIGSEVRRLPPERAVVVVTDDREVRDDARSCGANIVASAALVEFGLR